MPPAVGVAFLPGYPAWSGNWGMPFGYQGSWYYGSDFGYWNRPYGYGHGYGYGYDDSYGYGGYGYGVQGYGSYGYY
jgi:hypothetical protein